MRSLFLAFAFLVVSIGVPACAQTAADETALRRLPAAFSEAWNRHDGRELAALMAEDVDFVNVAARAVQGRQTFEVQHIELLTGPFSGSKLTPLEISVRYLRPDLAIVRWGWAMEGDRNPDGTPRPPRSGAMMMVAEKKSGAWLVAAGQNTNAPPPSDPGGRPPG